MKNKSNTKDQEKAADNAAFLLDETKSNQAEKSAPPKPYTVRDRGISSGGSYTLTADGKYEKFVDPSIKTQTGE